MEWILKLRFNSGNYNGIGVLLLLILIQVMYITGIVVPQNAPSGPTIRYRFSLIHSIYCFYQLNLHNHVLVYLRVRRAQVGI